MRVTLLTALLLVASFATLATAAATTTQFFVDCSAADAIISDEVDGLTPHTAFTSVRQARDAIRVLERPLSGSVRVSVAPGACTGPLTLDDAVRDSGSAHATITWEADSAGMCIYVYM